jgi:hypothetical protein
VFRIFSRAGDVAAEPEARCKLNFGLFKPSCNFVLDTSQNRTHALTSRLTCHCICRGGQTTSDLPFLSREAIANRTFSLGDEHAEGRLLQNKMCKWTTRKGGKSTCTFPGDSKRRALTFLDVGLCCWGPVEGTTCVAPGAAGCAQISLS